MRKWKQGVIAALVFFFSIAFMTTENLTIGVLAFAAMGFSMLYALVLVVLFTFQQVRMWSKKRWSKLRIEEKVVKTKVKTVYECGHCKMQYSDSQTCPHCGSPYRKTIEEKTEEETLEKWKT